MTYSQKLIDGVPHVWSIMDNAWIPEAEWDEIERERLRRDRSGERLPAAAAREEVAR